MKNENTQAIRWQTAWDYLRRFIYTGDKQQQSMILQRKRLTGSLLIIQLKYIKQYMKQR